MSLSMIKAPNKFIMLLFLLCFSNQLFAKRVIMVNNQNDFNNLKELLLSAIYNGDDNIYVVISSGQYEWNNFHISLSDIEAPSTSIHIMGKDVILVPKGKTYVDGECYEGVFSVDNSWMAESRNVDVWSNIRYPAGLVEIVDSDAKLCRLKSEETLSPDFSCIYSYILVTQWFLSGVYKVHKIEDNYIYFIVNDLVSNSYNGGYSINNDFNYKGLIPRYKFCNLSVAKDNLQISNGRISLPNGIKCVHEGLAGTFLSITSSKFHIVELSGINFWGSCNSDSRAVLYFNSVNASKITINKCNFNGLKGIAIGIVGTSNVHVDNNYFNDCYMDGILSNNSSNGTVVKNNSFLHMGKQMTNTNCVSCRGANFLIKSNYFEDYGYNGIAVGEHYNRKNVMCNGIVEENTLKYSHDYMNDIPNVALMDGGSIYLRTKMDGVVVRYNRIDGFSGMASNRGIYCDDGAYNFKIIGNVITGIANSHCIDSRRCAFVEDRNTPGTDIERSNVNIEMRDNVIDGTIRFVGHEDTNNGCVIGDNYYLVVNDTIMVNDVISKVRNDGLNISLIYTGDYNGRLGLARNSFRQLRRSPEWKAIRCFFVRKKQLN